MIARDLLVLDLQREHVLFLGIEDFRCVFLFDLVERLLSIF